MICSLTPLDVDELKSYSETLTPKRRYKKSKLLLHKKAYKFVLIRDCVHLNNNYGIYLIASIDNNPYVIVSPPKDIVPLELKLIDPCNCTVITYSPYYTENEITHKFIEVVLNDPKVRKLINKIQTALCSLAKNCNDLWSYEYLLSEPAIFLQLHYLLKYINENYYKKIKLILGDDY